MATAAEIVTALDTAFAANPAVGSVTIDGSTIRYHSPDQFRKIRGYFARLSARASGERPTIARIRLSGF